MKDSSLQPWIEACLSGEISPEDHRALASRLKSDPEARARFREAVDLQVSLRTWATEDDIAQQRGRAPGQSTRQASARRVPLAMLLTLAASIAIAMFPAWLLWRQKQELARSAQAPPARSEPSPAAVLGTVWFEEEGGKDGTGGLASGSRFSQGPFRLTGGVAELKFDSGTDVVLQAPCAMHIVSADTARLDSGRVVVNVTELSDGFLLKTPDATIRDEGTEYAVSLDAASTEVHVFDGTILWEPKSSTPSDPSPQRIPAGEARRYARSRPDRGTQIPLGANHFVRKLRRGGEESRGTAILAFDGFEGVPGRFRRNSGGLGWSSPWTPAFPHRGPIAALVPTPDDVVFGRHRAGQTQLQLSGGDAIRRELQQPLSLEVGKVYFFSFLLQRNAGIDTTGRFLQVSLLGDPSPNWRRPREIALGITSDAFPFLKTGGAITQSATRIDDEVTYFLIARLVVTDYRDLRVSLRAYRLGETVEDREPDAWTATSSTSGFPKELYRIRLAVGAEATYTLDQFKVTATWRDAAPWFSPSDEAVKDVDGDADR